MKTKQTNAECLKTTSLGYSIGKSTLLFTLTFIEVEIFKCENLDFVHLLSFFLLF